MEVRFNTTQIRGFKDLVREAENAEQTQELRLGDGMPDVGRVIASWGQSILRSKEWHTDYILSSCGMLVWVLYEPDGDGGMQVLSTWIPFQMRWDLPPDAREGEIRISLLTRFVDARSVSPRKIMVRAGMAAMAEALASETVDIQVPKEENSLPMLVTKHTVRLQKEAGEKTFLLDEELTLPQSVPVPEKIIYCTMEPKLSDSRVLADKLALRGQGNLHLLYQSKSGQVHSWDFEIPFSQYAQLQDSYGNDADGDVRFAVTSLEPELQEDGKLRLKCGLAAQYIIRDSQTISLLEDAYHPRRELQLRREEADIPSIADPEHRTVTAQAHVQTDTDLIPDVCFWPDFPISHKNGDDLELSIPGSFQVLYYEPDGQLRGTVARWEGREQVPASGRNEICLYPHQGDVQARAEDGNITLKTQLELTGTFSSGKKVPMITDITVGAEKLSDTPKPSLILRRCDKERLWDIAKQTGSAVEEIMAANGLEGPCEPGKLLLIPVKL